MKDSIERPAIVAADPKLEARCDAFAAKYKLAKTPLVIFLRDNIHELAILKEGLPHGGWGKFLKRIKLSRATAHRWLSNVSCETFDPLDFSEEDEAEEEVAPETPKSPVSESGIQTAPNDPPPAPAPDAHKFKLCAPCERNGRKKGCPACIALNSAPSMFGGTSAPPPPKPYPAAAPAAKLCGHCQEWGPTPDCSDCAAIRNPPKQQEFPWTKIEEPPAFVLKQAEKVAEAFPTHANTPEHRSVVRITEELAEAIAAWRKKIEKKQAMRF